MRAGRANWPLLIVGMALVDFHLLAAWAVGPRLYAAVLGGVALAVLLLAGARR